MIRKEQVGEIQCVRSELDITLLYFLPSDNLRSKRLEVYYSING